MSPSGLPDLPVVDSAIVLPSDQCLKKAYPLPADHLLHIIFQNALRGFYSNKDILSRLTIAFTANGEWAEPEFHSHHSVFPSYSVVFPTAPNIPGDLDPTPKQMSCAHSTWIDLLPFPKMRDNLIKWETGFDYLEFV
ncbi:hypothetical protein V1508DRAFT_424122 [Lipomyces doorenjongii]|uniref:uncharacterized protein n=1 Tax=Lipomyces doorenjongii TaxID=383834 RepID=UPI0034CF5AFA